MAELKRIRPKERPQSRSPGSRTATVVHQPVAGLDTEWRQHLVEQAKRFLGSYPSPHHNVDHRRGEARQQPYQAEESSLSRGMWVVSRASGGTIPTLKTLNITGT